MSAPATAEIQGHVEPGWEGVAQAFAANFTAGLEVGAAFAAYHRGSKVVDLWGGVADQRSGRPWTRETIVPLFSTTKGLTAVCANRLIEEGRLDPNEPVATYWPEFAAAGKAEITVADVLSHQAGLAWIDGRMSAEDALRWTPVVEALARQAPARVAGTHTYHAVTFGWLVGELVRRVTGMTIGAYFRAEVAEPLALDLWIGLPESEEPRVALFADVLPEGAFGHGQRRPSFGVVLAATLGPDSPLTKSLRAPGEAFDDFDIWNSRAMRAAEVPSANGVGDARSIARMYAACIDEVDGVRILGDEQARRAGTALSSGPDLALLNMDVQFGLGFMVRSDLVAIGAPGSFGHFGFGGSFGWADPDAHLAMGYAMNRLEIGLAGDARSVSLIGACYGAIR